MAAPGAMIAYALLGTSRTLIVSATTATSALSASAVGPLAHGDTARFAALSAALALVTAVVLAAGGRARARQPLGLRVQAGDGRLPVRPRPDDHPRPGAEAARRPGRQRPFFEQLGDLLRPPRRHPLVDGSPSGAASVAALLAFRRLAPQLPGTLIVLAASIVLAAVLGLDDRGVAVVGKLPRGLPDPAVPDVSIDDLVNLLPAAFGVMVLTAEAVGVGRALASKDGYQIDPSRELVAIGGSNALAGLSSGFVQSGGASQTMAAENAGGKTPADRAARRRAGPAHGRVPVAAVPRPPAGDARRDRRRRGRELRRRRRAPAAGAHPPQRDRARADRAGGRARVRRPAGSADRCRALADRRDPAAEPPDGCGHGPRPRHRALGKCGTQSGLGPAPRRARCRERGAAFLCQRGQRQGPDPRAGRRAEPRRLVVLDLSENVELDVETLDMLERARRRARSARASSCASRPSGAPPRS